MPRKMLCQPPPRGGVMAVVAGGLLLRLALLASTRGDPVFDIPMLDAEYAVDWARQISAEGMWSSPEGTAYFRTPLYAWLLAALFALPGPDLLAARVFQALLGALAAAGLAGVAGRRFGPRAFWATGVLAGASWPLLFFGRELLIVSIAFFIGTAVLVVADGLTRESRARKWLALGLLIGLGTLARANFVIVVVPFLALAVFGFGARARWVRVGALLAGVALCVAPVTLRNRAVSGEWIALSSQGGLNLWIGNHPGADGMSTEIPGMSFWRNEDVAAALAIEYGRPLGPGEQDRHYRQLAVEYFRSQPADAAGRLARKAYLFLQGYEIRNNKDLYVVRKRNRLLSLPLPDFGWVLPLALVGVIGSWRRRRELAHLWGFALAMSAAVILFFVCSRYRLPAWPPLLVYAGAGAGMLLDPTATWRRRLAWSGLLVAAIVGARVDFLDVRQPDASQPHYQIANSYVRAGRTIEAEQEYREAIRLAPGFAEARHHLGALMATQDRTDEALAELRAAARALPRSFRVRRTLAETLEAAGAAAEAVAVRREVAALSGRAPQDLIALGTTLGMNGEYAESLALFEGVERAGHALDGHFFLNAGQTALAMGRTPQGMTWLREALTDNATRTSAYGAIASYHLSTGSWELAVASLDEALTGVAEEPTLLRLRAVARYRMGDLAGAARDLEAVIRADPTDEDSRRRLAQMRGRDAPR